MTGEKLPPNQKASRPRRLDAAQQHQAGPFPRSVSGACLSSALLTNSTESIAAPSWVRNCSIASCIGGGRSPHHYLGNISARKGIKPQFPNGIVSSVSFVSTTNTARSLAGFVLLALALTLWRSPGSSEKLWPAL